MIHSDDIIKAIESHRKEECYNCPYEHLPRCFDRLCEDAVNIIKDSTEEKEANEIVAGVQQALAYEEGYKAGKLAAAEQLINDICQMGGCSRGIFINPWDIAELKEKYGVKTNDETNT